MNNSLEIISSETEPLDNFINDYYNNKGHLKVIIISDCNECQLLESSGCTQGLIESVGLEYTIVEMLGIDLDCYAIGATLSIKGITVNHFKDYKGDIDSDYYFESITTRI